MRTHGRLILIPHFVGPNLFLSDLVKAYVQLGYEVVVGRETFDMRSVVPDAVHLQWPEELYRWTGRGSPDERVERFCEVLDDYRKRGVRITWSVHNLHPHDSDEDVDRRAYQAVIDRTDVIGHFCEHSKALLRQRYRVPASVREIVQPLGNYSGYPGRMTKLEARERYDLPGDAFVMLCFGAVRPYKGLDLVLKAFRQARVDRKMLLVAGRYMASSNADRHRERLRMFMAKRLTRSVRWMLRHIPDEEVQPIVAACDIVVLGHTSALNSGVQVLGMTFGRPVVGPAVGCMDSALRDSGNFTYRAGDASSFARAMEAAAQSDLSTLGERNARLAATWNWTDIAAAYADATFPAA
jgi:glycosyltransferase involved in cell wall biosynthesis